MGKTIESPIKRWPGHVVLKYPTPLDPYEVWKAGVEKLNDAATTGDVAIDAAMMREMLPGICAMVEEWHLGGDFPPNVTPETFPFLPRVPSAKAIIWLIGEVTAIIAEADDLPLA